ncbi:hypothetical protein GUJ93_ZPchr0002g23283 [Zizania palustris]|uniref:Uncharacterized protein n=1 Tax=Zizania palustris TaxID=103762 RepID=A0A8J5VV00_ZIZPA|nr:hypothetical protein GUJ93_ZPchr0002g23283 [Zizania palustris]
MTGCHTAQALTFPVLCTTGLAGLDTRHLPVPLQFVQSLRNGNGPDHPPDYLLVHHYARQKGCRRSMSSFPIIVIHIHMYHMLSADHFRACRQLTGADDDLKNKSNILIFFLRRKPRGSVVLIWMGLLVFRPYLSAADHLVLVRAEDSCKQNSSKK